MKQSPIKNMAYWKGKNTISPVKQPYSPEILDGQGPDDGSVDWEAVAEQKSRMASPKDKDSKESSK